MTRETPPDTQFSITLATIPLAPNAPGWHDFVEMTAVRNAVEAEGYGSTEFARTAHELLPGWQNTEHRPNRLYLAHQGGRVVARGIIEWRTGAETADVAWLAIDVDRQARRQGIGSALAELLEAEASALGKKRLLVYAASRPAAGEQLTSPTGYGGVALANAETQFLLGRGYVLEQVERASRIALPVPEGLLGALREGVDERSGPDYRIHTWTGATPPRWREDLAMLLTRMSTDAPSAGLEEPEDAWSVERLLAEERAEVLSGRTTLKAVAEHVPSGRLVAFTVLDAPAESDRVVSQEDTLVLREHRGHRLGMLLKIANIQYLQQTRPGHPSIVTFNAEENRPMLNVNEAVGFVPIGYDGAWKKILG